MTGPASVAPEPAAPPVAVVPPVPVVPPVAAVPPVPVALLPPVPPPELEEPQPAARAKTIVKARTLLFIIAPTVPAGPSPVENRGRNYFDAPVGLESPARSASTAAAATVGSSRLRPASTSASHQTSRPSLRSMRQAAQNVCQ